MLILGEVQSWVVFTHSDLIHLIHYQYMSAPPSVSVLEKVMFSLVVAPVVFPEPQLYQVIGCVRT